ncbi:IPExxxVDY family protein [Flavobacterium sp. ASW18X]|uniref:IPExxxVDY family protein n=1 Tax=Flavobacterium sp. ASW18X TaxID=2572595 RepID=UPI0010ADF805|nr:IPExxxVDY family protein [Flavobacterium sp. ASW18X]TKD65225.1 IPExxxVDY family protein [Flavobacterium sp. ASW18X]
MAAVYKISEECFDDSFELIAIHTNLESYQLAYFINSVTDLQLARSFRDLVVDTVAYALYEYKDAISEEDWFLMANIAQKEDTGLAEGLFSQSNTLITYHLLEERKDINYLLKLSAEQTIQINNVLEQIKSIPKVRMAYALEPETLKSKKNLIF